MFYFFFLDLFTFYFLFCLTALDRTYSVMLKHNGERRYPCLVPDLSEKAFRLSPLSIILVVRLLYIFFIL